MKKYRILVWGFTENMGGVENVILNYYQNFDNRIAIDFMAESKKKMAYEDLLRRSGSRVFHLPRKRYHLLEYYQALKRFFSEHGSDYDCVWSNVNNLSNIDILVYAKRFGVKRRIIHSHNSKNMFKGIARYQRGIMQWKNKFIISKYATDYWACSKDAADYVFPAKVLSQVKIIRNAIEVSKYRFDEQKRKKIREQYNLEGHFVIGNVGRLHFQKNQIYILKILKKIKNDIPTAKLVFVGDGPDKNNLYDVAEKLNVKDDVIFAGSQAKIEDWYSAFDIFLFPSLFEGFGNALIEAQANGLMILASQNVIPKETIINSNYKMIPLDKGSNYWAKIIVDNFKVFNHKIPRELDENIKYNFESKGYNIETNAVKVEDLLLKDKSKHG